MNEGGRHFDSALDVIKQLAAGFSVGNRWYKGNLHVHAANMRADELIAASGKAGLDFLAITDHQTFHHVARVQEAAAGRLTIFPGMEITAHEGVHLLAVFPPQYSIDDQTKLLGFLELSGTGDTNKASRRTVAEIFAKVAEDGGIIVIPHPFANKTGLLDSARKISTKIEWLESGFVRLIQAPEDKLRYIAWDESGRWINRFVLASAKQEDVDSSTYCLAPINVSDCYDVNDVADSCTWFRMGEISIDGLKQVACEPAARVSNSPVPEETHSTILAVRVTGGFCDQQVFLFNSGLNCIVGQNHAGKSAVFDFIRFALEQDRTGPAGARGTLLTRLNAILGPGGCIEMIFRQDGRGYVIRRFLRPELVPQGGTVKVSSATEAARWFAFNRDTETLDPIAPFPFPVEVYEQGRIHRLREDIPRQLELLDEFAGLQDLKLKQTQFIDKLNASAEAIAPLRERLMGLAVELAKLPALEKELAEKEALLRMPGVPLKSSDARSTHFTTPSSVWQLST